MEEVGSACFICVNSTGDCEGFFCLSAALHSQGPSEEQCPHAAAAEREGGRRSERAGPVRVVNGSSC